MKLPQRLSGRLHDPFVAEGQARTAIGNAADAVFFAVIGLLMLTKRVILKQYGIPFLDFVAVVSGRLSSAKSFWLSIICRSLTGFLANH